MNTLGIVMSVVLVVGFAWADRINVRIVRSRTELESRRQERQAYEVQRKAASVRLVGAKR